jgi:hypothetical protein
LKKKGKRFDKKWRYALRYYPWHIPRLRFLIDEAFEIDEADEVRDGTGGQFP